MKNKKIIGEIYNIIIATDRCYYDFSKRNGLSFIQLMILYHLEYHPECTQKEICEALLLPKQTVHSILQNWKNLGYLNLDSKDTNRKEKKIILSEKGMQFLHFHIDKLSLLEEKIIDKMGVEKVYQMMECNRLFLDLFRGELDSNE